MNLSNDLYGKLNDILEFFDIKVIGKDLKNVDTKSIYKQVILLHSQNKINNTEYSLLNNLRNQLISINQYDDERSYIQLQQYLEYIENYSKGKSNSAKKEFVSLMQNLSSSSKESIINPEEFNDFNEYIHIERPIENNLKYVLEALSSREKGIVLLVGSVGDGKSHLLSYLRKNYDYLFNDVEIYNDATESSAPFKTAVETLSEKLNEYSHKNNKKIVIAINIGMLHKLNAYLQKHDDGVQLRKVIEMSRIFDTENMDTPVYSVEDVSIVSFLNESPFSIKNGDIRNEFYDAAMGKIFSEELENPFYRSFVEDDGPTRREPLYQNYKLMLNTSVQETIKLLLIKIQVENKRIMTTRAFFNFIHDIIIPENETRENDMFLVNLLFNKGEKSKILKSLETQDPLLKQSPKLDELNVDIYNAFDLLKKCKEIFGKDNFIKVKDYLYLLDGLNHRRKFEMIIRLHYLFEFELYDDKTFLEFINVVENVEQDKGIQRKILNKIVNAIELWNDSPKEEYIYKESMKPETKLRIGLEFKPKAKSIKISTNLTIKVEMQVQDDIYEIEIDYNLYKLLKLLESGYVLKEKDKSEAVVFEEFVDKILNQIISNKTTIISIPGSQEKFLIKEGMVGYEIRSVD